MPGIFITIMDEINFGRWSSGQVGEGRSMCLRWFCSLSRTRNRYSSSNRRKMKTLEPRRGGTRRRPDWIRVDNFPRILVIVSSSRDPERLGDKEHQARRLQGLDHLHVNVQWHCVEKEWWELYFEYRRSQELRRAVLTTTLDVIGSRIGREVVWRFPWWKNKGQWNCTANKMVQRFTETGHLVFTSKVPVLWVVESWSKVSCFESWMLWVRTIHFNGNSMNTELLFQTVHSVNQLSVYGAVVNWCYQFGLTEDEKGRASILVESWNHKKYNSWCLLGQEQLETGCQKGSWDQNYVF